jgi:calcium binding protein 39
LNFLLALAEPPIAEVEANPDQVSQLVSALVAEDLLFIFASNINKFSFEGRKDTQVILSYVFRYKAPSSPDPVVLNQVLSNRPEIIIELCNGYATAEGSGPCGTVLREILKYNSVAELILYDEPGQPAMSWDPNQPTTGKGVFWKFFTWIDQGAFETSADAFTTFRVRVYLLG